MKAILRCGTIISEYFGNVFLFMTVASDAANNAETKRRNLLPHWHEYPRAFWDFG